MADAAPLNKRARVEGHSKTETTRGSEIQVDEVEIVVSNQRDRNTVKERKQTGMEVKGSNQEAVSSNSKGELFCQFVSYQVELDQKNDKYERLVKISRDVTIASKRCIFMLHRVLDDDSKRDETLTQAKNKLQSIQNELLSKIFAETEKDDRFMYARAYWPGLEEYIEAITYCYYLQEHKLIARSNLKTIAPLAHKLITYYDFIAGIGDLSGELMRLCINASGSGKENISYQIYDFIQVLYKRYVAMAKDSKGLRVKCHQMQQNLVKVEKACYDLKLKKAEIFHK